MSANSDAIERIRRAAPSDAEALAQLFESSAISDDGTPAGRLRAVLEATEHAAVPGLQTGIKFHDKGFRKEFQDPWESSDNQVGHFLTAVGLSFNPAKVNESFAGRSLRAWLGAPAAMSDEEVAIRLCVGHEKAADPGKATAAIGGAIGGGATLIVSPVKNPLLVGAGAAAGAGVAILVAFRDQFAAATAADVQIFRNAERSLGSASPLDLGAASATVRGIKVDPSLRGNSYEDLLLSVFGWRLGQMIKDGTARSKADIAAWIRTNIKAAP